MPQTFDFTFDFDLALLKTAQNVIVIIKRL